jgi:hypothetical protein
MSRRNLTRLARRALAVAALAAVATASGVPTAAIDWVAAHDMVDVPYVRDCKGILRHPEECPPAHRQPARTAALR